jgi:hypothetical protein
MKASPAAGRGAAPGLQRRGTSPTASTDIFGAVCPKEGKGAALVLPFYNTAVMNLHMVENAILMARMLCSNLPVTVERRAAAMG